MSSRISSVPENMGWKIAYMAAVLQNDRRLMPGLIQAARDSLFERQRELLSSGPIPNEEIAAIDNALHVLETLLSTLPYRDESDEWSRPVEDS